MLLCFAVNKLISWWMACECWAISAWINWPALVPNLPWGLGRVQPWECPALAGRVLPPTRFNSDCRTLVGWLGASSSPNQMNMQYKFCQLIYFMLKEIKLCCFLYRFCSLQSLLTDPNPSSPANPEAAQLFQHDIQAYNKFVTSINFHFPFLSPWFNMFRL